jgi:hypothetical protein
MEGLEFLLVIAFFTWCGIFIGYQYSKWRIGKTYKRKQANELLPHVSGSLLTDEQSYEIAQKFYEYCYMQQDDSLAIGAKAIPLIFNECLKMLASNNR